MTTLTTSDLISTMLTNVAGPALVTRTFIPLIEQSNRKVIANVSSLLASIGTDFGKECTSYSISKCGLNMLVRMVQTKCIGQHSYLYRLTSLQRSAQT